MVRTTFFLAALFGCAAHAVGQNPYVMTIYGDGVHAFFDHRHDDARQQFDKAINNGSRDPRVYYFRAMTFMQQGNVGAAENDIRTGAAFELRGLGTFDIGMALNRIQGHHRIQFEDIRTQAMLDLSSRQPPSTPGYRPPPTTPLSDQIPGDEPNRLPDDPFGDDDESVGDSDLNLGEPSSDLDPDVAPDGDDGLMDDGFGDDGFDDVPADDGGMDAGDDAFSDDGDDPFGAGADDDPFADPATDDAGDDPFGDTTDIEDDPFG